MSGEEEKLVGKAFGTNISKHGFAWCLESTNYLSNKWISWFCFSLIIDKNNQSILLKCAWISIALEIY